MNVVKEIRSGVKTLYHDNNISRDKIYSFNFVSLLFSLNWYQYIDYSPS